MNNIRRWLEGATTDVACGDKAEAVLNGLNPRIRLSSLLTAATILMQHPIQPVPVSCSTWRFNLHLWWTRLTHGFLWHGGQQVPCPGHCGTVQGNSGPSVCKRSITDQSYYSGIVFNPVGMLGAVTGFQAFSQLQRVSRLGACG